MPARVPEQGAVMMTKRDGAGTTPHQQTSPNPTRRAVLEALRENGRDRRTGHPKRIALGRADEPLPACCAEGGNTTVDSGRGLF